MSDEQTGQPLTGKARSLANLRPFAKGSDIAGERRRLEIAMDTLWPAVKAGDRKVIETWRKLGSDLRLLNGWIAPPSSGFHVSVNVAQVTSGSTKLEALLDSLMALPQSEHLAETTDITKLSHRTETGHCEPE